MKQLKSNVLFICSIFFLYSCGGDEAATTEPASTGTISGYIYNAATSLPIASSNVTSNPPTSAVTTDTLGAYIILNVEPEIYVVYASKLGFLSDSTRISVTAGKNTIADLFLEKDSTKINLE